MKTLTREEVKSRMDLFLEMYEFATVSVLNLGRLFNQVFKDMTMDDFETLIDIVKEFEQEMNDKNISNLERYFYIDEVTGKKYLFNTWFFQYANLKSYVNLWNLNQLKTCLNLYIFYSKNKIEGFVKGNKALLVNLNKFFEKTIKQSWLSDKKEEIDELEEYVLSLLTEKEVKKYKQIKMEEKLECN